MSSEVASAQVLGQTVHAEATAFLFVHGANTDTILRLVRVWCLMVLASCSFFCKTLCSKASTNKYTQKLTVFQFNACLIHLSHNLLQLVILHLSIK